MHHLDRLLEVGVVPLTLAVATAYALRELRYFQLKSPNPQTRILRIALAAFVGIVLGIFSRLMWPPPADEWRTYLIFLVFGPLAVGFAGSWVTKRTLKNRDQVRFANFWMFFWVYLSLFVTRTNISH